uniref:Uncharacterized protein n=1 Tax=Sphaerodactylus townsendi TaxID=933632 RepID=A0ACB8EJF9_9SAUR
MSSIAVIQHQKKLKRRSSPRKWNFRMRAGEVDRWIIAYFEAGEESGQEKQSPKFEAGGGGEKPLRRERAKPMAGMQFHSDASYVSGREKAGEKLKTNSIQPKRGEIEKPTAGMRFSLEASGVHHASVEERENRQPEVFQERVTSQEPAVKMGSIAVIQQQRVGGKEVISQEQSLWAERMRSEPVILGQSIQVCGSIETASDLSSIKMNLLKEIPYKHCGQMYVKLPCEVDVKLMDLVELHVSFKKFNGKIRVLSHEKGNKDFIIGTDLLFRNAQMNVSTNSQESVFCDGVVEDEILCEQGEEKGLTLAASPPEEQQEGMCKTALPEGSPEQSADALSELLLPLLS